MLRVLYVLVEIVPSSSHDCRRHRRNEMLRVGRKVEVVMLRVLYVLST